MKEQYFPTKTQGICSYREDEELIFGSSDVFSFRFWLLSILLEFQYSSEESLLRATVRIALRIYKLSSSPVYR